MTIIKNMASIKKKILFHYSIFNIGGAERSLIRLTKGLADRGWEVELVCTTGGGALEKELDSRVKLSFLRKKQSGLRFKKASTFLSRIYAIDDLIHYAFRRIEAATRSFFYRFHHYDVAVVSLHGLDPSFICKSVNADIKLHWIRNDLKLCDEDNKAFNNITKYSDYIDTYVCVAKTVKNSFDRLFPELRDRSEVIYNVIEPEIMMEKTRLPPKPVELNRAGLNVLSVCRLSDKSKAIFRMVDVHKALLDGGYDFNWFVIGDGPDRIALEEKIRINGLSSKFILLGKKNNPFPYYSQCDLVAMLSYYEGLCGVVNEAKVCGKAIIATEVSGIHEQLSHNINGYIVDNDYDSIIEGFKVFLDRNLVKELSNSIYPKEIIDDDSKYINLERIVNKNDR